MKKVTIIRTIITLIIILTLAVIWGHSFMSRAQSSEESSYVKDILESFINSSGNIFVISELLIRKAAHFIEYAVLGIEFISLITLGQLITQETKAYILYAISSVAALFVALTDETIQFFSGRASRVLDVWLDFAGASVAICLYLIIWSIIKGRISNKLSK